MADDEYEEEQELVDEFDSDFNDEVLAFVQSQYTFWSDRVGWIFMFHFAAGSCKFPPRILNIYIMELVKVGLKESQM